MTSDEWIPYIVAWRERRRRAAEALHLRVEIGRDAARECARVLVDWNSWRQWIGARKADEQRETAPTS
jgi:hypothetical protein